MNFRSLGVFLETCAFRASGLEFIDVTLGPLSVVALLDRTCPQEPDQNVLPPVSVRCQSEPVGIPFQFLRVGTTWTGLVITEGWMAGSCAPP